MNNQTWLLLLFLLAACTKPAFKGSEATPSAESLALRGVTLASLRELKQKGATAFRLDTSKPRRLYVIVVGELQTSSVSLDSGESISKVTKCTFEITAANDGELNSGVTYKCEGDE